MMVLQLVDLSEKSPLPEEALRFVSSEKRKRLFHMVREEDKKRGLVGELLIRQAAGRRLEVPLQEVPIRRTRYGKPYIPGAGDFHVNISHSGCFVALAVGSRPIGVDVERMAEIDLKVAARFFTPQEYAYILSFADTRRRLRAFYTLWTLKESYIKAVGKGLSIPLNSFGFRLDDDIRLERGPDREGYRFHTQHLVGGEEYWLSLCYREEGEWRIRRMTERGFYNGLGIL